MYKSYTEQIEDAYWDQWEIFDTNSKDETYDQVINFLNNDENFRSFGEGLIQLMTEKHRTQKIEDPIKFLKEMCLKNNVDISEIGKRDVTLKSWFYGDKCLPLHSPWSLHRKKPLNSSIRYTLIEHLILEMQMRSSFIIACLKRNLGKMPNA